MKGMLEESGEYHRELKLKEALCYLDQVNTPTLGLVTIARGDTVLIKLVGLGSLKTVYARPVRLLRGGSPFTNTGASRRWTIRNMRVQGLH